MSTIKYKRINYILPENGLVVTKHCNIRRKSAAKIINRLFEKSHKEGALIRSKTELMFLGSNKSIIRKGNDMYLFESPTYSVYGGNMKQIIDAGFTHWYEKETDLWVPIDIGNPVC